MNEPNERLPPYPLDLVRRSIRLVADRYWILVGISLATSCISAVSLGILAGPALCATFSCYLTKLQHGELELQSAIDAALTSIGRSILATCIIGGLALLSLLALSSLPMLLFDIEPGSGLAPSLQELALVVVALSVTSLCLAPPSLLAFPVLAREDLPATEAIRWSYSAALLNGRAFALACSSSCCRRSGSRRSPSSMRTCVRPMPHRTHQISRSLPQTAKRTRCNQTRSPGAVHHSVLNSSSRAS